MKKVSEKQKKWIERTVANDRSYKILVYNRFFLTLIFVLAQLLAYALLFLSFATDPKVGVFVQAAVFLLEIVFVLRIINATTHLAVTNKRVIGKVGVDYRYFDFSRLWCTHVLIQRRRKTDVANETQGGAFEEERVSALETA